MIDYEIKKGKMFLLSLGMHLTLIGLFIFLPKLFNYNPVPSTPIYINLVELPHIMGNKGIKVRKAKIKTVPPISKSLKKEKNSTSKRKADIKKRNLVSKNVVNIGKRKKNRRVNRKKKIKVMEKSENIISNRIKEIRKKKEKEEIIERAISNIKKRVAENGQYYGIIGNIGVKGSIDLTNIEYKIYYNTIWERIKSSWTLPEDIKEKEADLEAIISIKIDKNGILNNIWIERGSGNKYFDQSALRAISKAVPFPPPPMERSLEIGIRFRANE
jgi:TonB family protein